MPSGMRRGWLASVQGVVLGVLEGVVDDVAAAQPGPFPLTCIQHLLLAEGRERVDGGRRQRLLHRRAVQG